ncbi:Hypothetical protein P9211_14321 [Prochlorococcus marinus str. MIT 9211]|uniref:Uncharacterized protein n=1 Tax=Prochlorococcus marinus (strain MIT 9211) TaxID=93059 RepID=A9BC01_PROM4|nr:Hypothetical protein P9211_14321 [Prochlorococcus marinus str. MIT 9211]
MNGILLSLNAKEWFYYLYQHIHQPMAEQKGKELATVSVYLNTGIVAGLVGLGFVGAALVFGVLTLIIR